jgi:hypothetical protein
MRLPTYYDHIFIFAMDMLFDKRRINIGSADKILAAQQKMNKLFAAAKAKGGMGIMGFLRL